MFTAYSWLNTNFIGQDIYTSVIAYKTTRHRKAEDWSVISTSPKFWYRNFPPTSYPRPVTLPRLGWHVFWASSEERFAIRHRILKDTLTTHYTQQNSYSGSVGCNVMGCTGWEARQRKTSTTHTHSTENTVKHPRRSRRSLCCQTMPAHQTHNRLWNQPLSQEAIFWRVEKSASLVLLSLQVTNLWRQLTWALRVTYHLTCHCVLTPFTRVYFSS
jgi:hypothetical protein